MTGDQQDILERLHALLPRGWFGDAPPILTALLTGFAAIFANVYAVLSYARLQLRIATATDGWLDIISADFFGTTLPRKAGESDTAFRNRITVNLFRERATRKAVVQVLTTLTGRAPLIIEPRRPLDTGAYGGTEAISFVGTPLIYRSDWQGNQLLYATPRTNLSTQSQSFDNAAWTKSASSIVPNAKTAPDGTATMGKLVEDSTNNQHYVSRLDQTISPNTAYSVAVFASAAERRFLCVGWRTGGSWVGGQPSATFDLVAGTVNLTGTGATASIQNLGGGIYKCMVTAVSGATGFSSGPFYQLLAAGGTLGVSYLGDGASGAYVWGAQTEVGNASTSYIPTTYAAVTVTDYSISGNVITTGVPPVVGAVLSWTGAYQSTALGKQFSVTGQVFGNGNGGATVFPIVDTYATGPCGYGVAGAYGSLLLSYQAFVTAYRPSGTGIPYVAGYGSSPSGYSVASRGEYASLSMVQQSVSDADIYAAIASVIPAGAIAWTRISS